MAKKKDENQEVAAAGNSELDALKAQVEDHQKTIENFRISFQNLETALRNLKERNRLR